MRPAFRVDIEGDFPPAVVPRPRNDWNFCQGLKVIFLIATYRA